MLRRPATWGDLRVMGHRRRPAWGVAAWLVVAAAGRSGLPPPDMTMARIAMRTTPAATTGRARRVAFRLNMF